MPAATVLYYLCVGNEDLIAKWGEINKKTVLLSYFSASTSGLHIIKAHILNVGKDSLEIIKHTAWQQTAQLRKAGLLKLHLLKFYLVD